MYKWQYDFLIQVLKQYQKHGKLEIIMVKDNGRTVINKMMKEREKNNV